MVLPEDYANLEIAKGFEKCQAAQTRFYQVLPPSGGWLKVVEEFLADHVPVMSSKPQRFMVLLIDFDEHPDRFQQVSARIPDSLKDRVFILGAWTEPDGSKGLKSNLRKKFEEIGSAAAESCRSQDEEFWTHPLLQHNLPEFRRLQTAVRGFLFT
jgi:hypothetical protein